MDYSHGLLPYDSSNLQSKNKQCIKNDKQNSKHDEMTYVKYCGVPCDRGLQLSLLDYLMVVGFQLPK